MLRFPAAALNHLLSQSGWALQRLAIHSGKTARFNIAPFSFSCIIHSDGTVSASAADASPDVICVIPPSLLPRLALHDENAFAQITGTGDAALLTEIFYLGRHLRWDAAEDIGRATGDVAAERIVQLAQSGYQRIHDISTNLSQALVEYWTEERPLLAKPGHIAVFAQQVNQLNEDLAQIEQRIARLGNKSSC